MAYFSLHLTSNETSFEYSFPQEFLDKKYEIGLLKLDGKLEIDNKININQTNNKFYYAIDGIDKNNNQIYEEKSIDIPEGKYNFNELIGKINELLYKYKKFFDAKLEDYKIILDIKKGFSVDFTKNNTLSNALGFSNKLLTCGKHVSENIFNDNIFIWCNLIDDSYANNKKLNAIYRFRLIESSKLNDGHPDVISKEPANISYHKVTGRPNKIVIKLVDINNKIIDFKNISLFIDLKLKELS